MKRTPLGSRFIKQLIRVNDQVCFTALQQWEFTQHLDLLVSASPKEFTTAAFTTNPFAKNIYRRLGELSEFAKEAEGVALQMGIIAAVEYVLAYMEEVQQLREELVTDPGDLITDDAEEEQLRLKITRWQGDAPVAWYFRTVGFFRLLRNHYAHVNETPSSAFKTYARSYGTPLSKFWDNGVTDIHGIDFATLATTTLTPDLAFGAMNLLRICVQHIDAMVADTVSSTAIVKWMVSRSPPHERNLTNERLSLKVTGRLRADWNVEEPLPVVMTHVEDAIAAAASS
ncbi:hypothetical protein RAD15_13850 [Bradyrhizobium sp. 14AA]